MFTFQHTHNRFVMQYLVWRVLTGLNTKIEMSFMVVGHTKFAPDWASFGYKARHYWLYGGKKEITMAEARYLLRISSFGFYLFSLALAGGRYLLLTPLPLPSWP